MLNSDVVKTKTKASTLQANAWTFKAKAFEHTARAEITMHSTSDSLTG